LIRSGQHNRIQFNNLSILPNAEMGDPPIKRVTVWRRSIRKSSIFTASGSSLTMIPEIQQLKARARAIPRRDGRRRAQAAESPGHSSSSSTRSPVNIG